MSALRLKLVDGIGQPAALTVRLLGRALVANRDGSVELDEELSRQVATALSDEDALAIEWRDGDGWQRTTLETGILRDELAKHGELRVRLIARAKQTTPSAVPPSESLWRLELGPRFSFEAVIGRGGAGVVVRARDLVLDRLVAIKLLAADVADLPDAAEIFRREARALALVSHRNLVAVHDIVELGSRTLMVMELVEGQGLDRLLGDDGLSLEQRLALALQLCQVVDHLHRHGLVHRDIKPGNILVTADGTLKLIDFGLARRLDYLRNRITRVRGTPAYMSPEQFSGATLSPASDLYQLGVSLYELFLGELPFATGDMLYAHVFARPPSLLQRRPELGELAQLVDRCLEKDPVARPLRALRLAEAIQGLLGEPRTTQSSVSTSRAPTSSLPWLAAAGLSAPALRRLDDPAFGADASLRPTLTASQAHGAPTEPSSAADFDAVLEEGLSALLAKDYARALQAMQRAAALQPEHATVRANLTRLRELGFGDG